MEYKPPATPRRTAVRHSVRRSHAPDEVKDALQWATEHRGKAARSFAPSAGRQAEKIIKPLARSFGTAAGELDEHWKEIVGAQLAQWSRPEKFQGGAGGSTLVVVARGPAAALIEAQSARILERVAQYTGRRPARLRIVQGAIRPAPQPKTQRTVRVTPAPPAPPLPAGDKERLAALLRRWEHEVEARERARPVRNLTKPSS